MQKFDWRQTHQGYTAEMPGNVTLCVTPDQTVGFVPKPRRGTTWRAQASHWDEVTRCMNRHGRDEYSIQHKRREDAMRAAERIYLEA